MSFEKKQKSVLIYVPKIYEPENNLFTGDKSGLAIYVHEIADSIKNSVNVNILTYKPTKAVFLNGLHYVSHTRQDFLKSLRLSNILRGVKKFFLAGGGLNKRLKAFYWACDVGCFEKALRDLHPDIVHFHGANPELMEQVKLCLKYQIPFAVTLHGFIGSLEGRGTVRATQISERLFLQSADKNNWPVTIVSSGSKRRACELYGLKGDNIKVILNGTNIALKDSNLISKEEIYSRHGLALEKDIIVCVGTLSDKKNQIAVVRAWQKVEPFVREKYSVLFLGVDRTGQRIQKLIEAEGLTEELIVCGFVNPDELPAYYKAASLNIVASLDEGFGLSFIEAMAFGVPTLTFSDLDAVDDLFDDNAMMLLNKRDDLTLARGISEALSGKWDSKAITAISQKYLMSNIGKQYLKLYSEEADI